MLSIFLPSKDLYVSDGAHTALYRAAGASPAGAINRSRYPKSSQGTLGPNPDRKPFPQHGHSSVGRNIIHDVNQVHVHGKTRHSGA